MDGAGNKVRVRSDMWERNYRLDLKPGCPLEGFTSWGPPSPKFIYFLTFQIEHDKRIKHLIEIQKKNTAAAYYQTGFPWKKDTKIIIKEKEFTPEPFFYKEQRRTLFGSTEATESTKINLKKHTWSSLQLLFDSVAETQTRTKSTSRPSRFHQLWSLLSGLGDGCLLSSVL